MKTTTIFMMTKSDTIKLPSFSKVMRGGSKKTSVYLWHYLLTAVTCFTKSQYSFDWYKSIVLTAMVLKRSCLSSSPLMFTKFNGVFPGILCAPDHLVNIKKLSKYINTHMTRGNPDHTNFDLTSSSAVKLITQFLKKFYKVVWCPQNGN